MRLHLPKVLLTVVLACFSFATPSLAKWEGNTYYLESKSTESVSTAGSSENIAFIRTNNNKEFKEATIEKVTIGATRTLNIDGSWDKEGEMEFSNLLIEELEVNGGNLTVYVDNTVTIDKVSDGNGGSGSLNNFTCNGPVTLKSDVTVTGDLKMYKRAKTDKIPESVASLTLANNASLKVDKTKSIISKGSAAGVDGSAMVKLNKTGANVTYTLGSADYEIQNARVEVSNGVAVNVGNILKNVDLVNNGTGTLTASNGNNDYATISVLKGDIILEGLAAEAKNGNVDTINALTIGAGRTLSVYTQGGAESYTEDNEATLLVAADGTASFGSGAKLNGNLVLSSGVTVSMDSALTMGSDLTLSEGMTLDGDVLTSVMALGAGEKVNLFTGVDKLYLGASAPASDILTEDSDVLLGTYFNFAGVNDTYYLGYDDAGNVYAGVIAPPPVDPTPGDNVPEPTTATLSLLALAGLAARRRRK